jgi:hypothetical protein
MAKTDAGVRAWIAVDTKACSRKTIGGIGSQNNFRRARAPGQSILPGSRETAWMKFFEK